jgi:hypothetical protein
MEWDGMLAIHILYVMYELKSRSSRSLKDNLPSVPEVLQPEQVLPMLLYTVHYKNSICIPITFSLFKS